MKTLAQPFLLEKARQSHRMGGDGKLIDSIIKDGLWCSLNDYISAFPIIF
ncbi:MAG: hypothetical protein ACSLEM_05190 [Candidatus Malihini olakiniferum]